MGSPVPAKARYLTGGLQPALAVRRLSSATTPGVERDGPSMRRRECAGITFAAHSSLMVNSWLVSGSDPMARPANEALSRLEGLTPSLRLNCQSHTALPAPVRRYILKAHAQPPARPIPMPVDARP